MVRAAQETTRRNAARWDASGIDEQIAALKETADDPEASEELLLTQIHRSIQKVKSFLGETSNG